jgi:hypothetical protein
MPPTVAPSFGGLAQNSDDALAPMLRISTAAAAAAAAASAAAEAI